MNNLKLSALADGLETLLKNIAAICLISMALLTGADIISRGLFGAPIFGVEEIVAILAVMTTGLALGYAHSQKSNIGVEFLYSKLSRRARRRMNIFSNTLSAALFATVTWRLYLYGVSMGKSGEVSMTLELPTDMVIYALTFGFGCFTLVIIKELLMLFTGEE
ncbi:TRAP transporter small permease [Maridesulfovibrio sp.]|uniref:TRAP transporter small permease n=1 Tax=Maridesulfovibrio sp. TaxID=2795000 RepID=UPI002A18A953|nr:TRAP transporter small permease [Maridesulfovibrio sp.]